MANKDIFCAVPWHNSHMYWDGTHGACCSERTKPRGPEKNLSDTTIIEWYNSQAMRDFRLRIFGDDKLPECQGCYQEESFGHESRRIKENYKVAIFTKQAFEKSYTQSPWNSKFQASLIDGKTDKLPIDLHVDFGNECNLACKMCFPSASSRVAHYYQKWQITQNQKSNWTDSDQLYAQFLENIASIPNLNRIHIMGGEPLYNKKFYKFIDWLIEKNYQNLSLSFVSNGTLIDKEILDKLSFFRSADIEISLESIEANNHYIRQGSDTEKVLENLHTLLKYRSNKLNVVLRSVPQLLNVNNYYKYIQFAYNNKISIQSTPLISPDYLAIDVLPADIRNNFITSYEQVRNQIQTGASQMLTLTTGRDTSRLEQQLVNECNVVIAMLKQSESENVQQLRYELITWLKRWDKAFALDALDFYPEYKDFLIEYGYCNRFHT